MSNTSLKTNFLFRFFYDFVAVIVPLVTAPYVGRVLGPDGCGIYSYTNANVTIFMLFAALGTIGYGSREIARNRKDPQKYSVLFWEIELLTIITSTICFFAFLIFASFSKEYRIYYLILSPLIISSLLDISWFYTGLEQIKYMSVANSILKILSTICIFLFVKDHSDLKIYFIIHSVMLILSTGTMWLFLRKFLVKVSFKELRIFRHFKETLVFFIPTISISIYTVLDKTLIGIITKDTFQNGYYDRATQIFNILKTLTFASIGVVMESRSSFLYAENRISEIKVKILQTINIIFFLAFGCGFGILAVADNFIPLFLGDKFIPSIPLLKFMSPLLFIIGISNCLGSLYYNPFGKRSVSARFLIAGAITNLCGNLLLIPKLGANGAIIGTLIAESVITLLYLINCDKFLTVSELFQTSIKKAIAGVFMFIIVLLIGKINMLPLFLVCLQIITGVIVYSLILYILKDQSLTMFLDIIKKRVKAKKT